MAVLEEGKWRPPLEGILKLSPIPRLNVALDRPEPVEPVYAVPDGAAPLGGEPVGDADGDALLGGSLEMTGGATAEGEIKIATSINPAEREWYAIRKGILSGRFTREEATGTILRELATQNFPNLVVFLNTKFPARSWGKGEKREVGRGDQPIVVAPGVKIPLVKVNVDERGPFGETALMQAAVNGRIEALQTLLNAKANVNAQNNDGETALMWAAAYNETEIIKLLLAARANPNLTDKRGMNALMVAAWAGNKEAVQLLKPKSNASAKEVNGFTVSELPANELAPATIRGVDETIVSVLAEAEPKRGWFSRLTRRGGKRGKKTTQRRQKTKQKKRSRR